MSESPQNQEQLSPLGKEVVNNVALVWVRRRVLWRLLPLGLLILGALLILAQRVFWEHVLENAGESRNVLSYFWYAYFHTGHMVQLALLAGLVLVIASTFQLAAVLRRLLR